MSPWTELAGERNLTENLFKNLSKMVATPAPMVGSAIKTEETEAELDRRFEIARNELDRLLAMPVHQAQRDTLMTNEAYKAKVEWMEDDPDTCEKLNGWLRSKTLEHNIRMAVARDRAVPDTEALQQRLDEAAERGIAWTLRGKVSV